MKVASGVDTMGEGAGPRTTAFLLGEPRKGGPNPPTDVTTGVKGGICGRQRLSRRDRLLLCCAWVGLRPVESRPSWYARFLLSLRAWMTLSVEHGSCLSASGLAAGWPNV